MAFKITKSIVRDYLGCQDRDIVYGTGADAVLAAVKQHRVELARELRDLESRDDKSVAKVLDEAGLPNFIDANRFVTALRVLVALESVKP